MSVSVETLTTRSRLDSIDLVRIDMQRAHPNPFGVLPVHPTLHLTLRSDVRVPNTISSNGFAVLAEIELDWHDDEGDAVAALSISYRLAYEVTQPIELDADVVMRFATQVAMHHAWPFLRERVRVLSGEMGLPPLLLPMRHLGHHGQTTSNISGTVRLDDPRLR